MRMAGWMNDDWMYCRPRSYCCAGITYPLVQNVRSPEWGGDVPSALCPAPGPMAVVYARVAEQGACGTPPPHCHRLIVVVRFCCPIKVSNIKTIEQFHSNDLIQNDCTTNDTFTLSE
jgi:hypothetical protein